MSLLADKFHVVPIRFNSRVSSGSHHEVFVKIDSSEKVDRLYRPKGKTLFIVNIPPWMGYRELCKMLEPSEAEHIYIQKEAGVHAPLNENELREYAGFRVAYVIFKEKSQLNEVLNRKYKKEITIFEDRGTELVGMRRWINLYTRRFVPRKMLEAEISTVVKQYDERVEQEKAMAEKMQEPDEDGWITVTKHGKRPVIPRIEAVQARLMEKEKVKNKRKQLDNFYTFQAKRTKLNRLQELRRKFDEDKRKVALMKAQRKFKPL